MGHDDDGVVALELGDQFLDLPGRDRVQRRARLIEQQHLGLDGDAARNAQPLLLPARETGAALGQLVFNLAPQGRLAQGPLNAFLQVGGVERFKQLHAESNIVKNRHRKRRWLLEHHADLGPQQRHILFAGQQILAIEQNFTFSALLRIELEHPIENTQQSRFATAGRANEGGHFVFGNLQADISERVELAIKEVQILDGNLGRCIRDDGSVHVQFFSGLAAG